MNKQPEQTAKTRQSIINAFWELAEENGLDKVTVSAVTKKANLNRGTFYTYFADMPDLIAQAEDEIIHDYQSWAMNMLSKGAFGNTVIVSAHVSEIFSRYDNKFFMLIGKNGDPNFRAVLQNEATKMYRKVFADYTDTVNGEYYTAYITSAAIGTLSYWHDHGRQLPIEELAKIISGLATKGLAGTIELR